jgi:hypothetical protein
MRFSLKENRTRGSCLQREAGNPGPVEMTKGRVVMDRSGGLGKNKTADLSTALRSGRDDKG